MIYLGILRLSHVADHGIHRRFFDLFIQRRLIDIRRLFDIDIIRRFVVVGNRRFRNVFDVGILGDDERKRAAGRVPVALLVCRGPVLAQLEIQSHF